MPTTLTRLTWKLRNDKSKKQYSRRTSLGSEAETERLKGLLAASGYDYEILEEHPEQV